MVRLLCITSLMALFVICGCSPYHARVHDGHLCLNNSTWRGISSAEFDVKYASSKFSNKYEFSIFRNSDILFSEQSDPNKIHNLWVVEGRTLLSEKIALDYGYEIDYIDTPNLTCQLILTLISLSTDQSPLDFKGEYLHEINENRFPIKVTTQSASGLFEAPWKASLDLQKSSDGRIAFHINFAAASENNEPYPMTFSGSVSPLIELPVSPLHDAKDISQWHQYRIGVLERTMNGRMIFEYGAEEYKEKFQTIKELRDFHKNQPVGCAVRLHTPRT